MLHHGYILIVYLWNIIRAKYNRWLWKAVDGPQNKNFQSNLNTGHILNIIAGIGINLILRIISDYNWYCIRYCISIPSISSKLHPSFQLSNTNESIYQLQIVRYSTFISTLMYVLCTTLYFPEGRSTSQYCTCVMIVCLETTINFMIPIWKTITE